MVLPYCRILCVHVWAATADRIDQELRRRGYPFRRSMSGHFTYRHHEAHRTKLYIPEETTFSIPLDIHWRHEAHENKIDNASEQSLNDYCRNTWNSIDEPVVTLEQNVYGYPPTGLLRDRKLQEVLLKQKLGKGSDVGVSCAHRKSQLFFSVYADDIKMAGERKIGREREHLALMWTILRRGFDLEVPTPLLNQMNLVVTQRDAEVDHHAVKAQADLFRRITTTVVTHERQNKNNNSCQPTTAWSYDIEGHAEKCVERFCEMLWENMLSAPKPAETSCLDVPLLFEAFDTFPIGRPSTFQNNWFCVSRDVSWDGRIFAAQSFRHTHAHTHINSRAV